MRAIPQAEFVKSATAPAHYPDGDLPEVAFVGRSNVGKSSLLNSLVGRKKLAHISSTPGKTRHINFYLIDRVYHFVDLPGYGYAKVSKTEREAWRKSIESYLTGRSQLRLVVSLIDIRHEPTRLDRDLIEWLDQLGLPFIIVLTKSDKVKSGEIATRLKEVNELFSSSPKFLEAIPFSIKDKDSRWTILNAIEARANL